MCQLGIHAAHVSIKLSRRRLRDTCPSCLALPAPAIRSEPSNPRSSSQSSSSQYSHASPSAPSASVPLTSQRSLVPLNCLALDKTAAGCSLPSRPAPTGACPRVASLVAASDTSHHAPGPAVLAHARCPKLAVNPRLHHGALSEPSSSHPRRRPSVDCPGREQPVHPQPDLFAALEDHPAAALPAQCEARPAHPQDSHPRLHGVRCWSRALAMGQGSPALPRKDPTHEGSCEPILAP